MTDLFLSFEDESGETRRVAVDADIFVIGRHPENDLPIRDKRLSRTHVEIERFGDDYLAQDVGSTNGTKLNGVDLSEPRTLGHGDVLNLGGGLKISVELLDEASYESLAPTEEPENEDEVAEPEIAVEKPSAPRARPVDEGPDWGRILLIAPLLGIVLLIFVGAGIFLMTGKSKADDIEPYDDDDLIATRDTDSFDDDDGAVEDQPVTPVKNEPTTPTTTAENPVTSTNPDSTAPVPSETTEVPPPKKDTESERIELSAVRFMRRIARNDPSPVLTKRQVAVVKGKINQYKGSSGLASNIRNAQTNASAIAGLARSKNLKPQFLANAALAKLGKSRGNVLTTAQGMLEVLDNLNIQIGDEVADESLVTIAAYQQGVAGQFLKMRNTMEKLSTDNPSVSSRQVRTIWFLRDKRKISDAEFEFALRFLAIGTITQDPKSFGVNAEKLSVG